MAKFKKFKTVDFYSLIDRPYSLKPAPFPKMIFLLFSTRYSSQVAIDTI